MKIFPIDFLEGELLASPSKSYSHRAFALALMATSPSKIINPLIEGVGEVMIEFCRHLGANFESIEDPAYPSTYKIYRITPPKVRKAPTEKIDGKNSGTSIRILTALAPLFSGDIQIFGTFFDRKRPLGELLDALAQIGVKSEEVENPKGVLIHSIHPDAGIINIRGDISSQYITGLLMLAPHLKATAHCHESIINITTPAKSFPYLQITQKMFEEFGIQMKAEFDDQLLGRYIIPANQSFPGKEYIVPGDFSSAAFILVAAALNPFPKKVIIQNLDLQDPQGDKAIISILQKAGAKIQIDETQRLVEVTGGEYLYGQQIDCGQIPDLFPILCVLGIYSNETTRIYNAKHVRIKETDRVMLMVRELRKMGAKIDEFDDGVLIVGPQSLIGTTIDHQEDHRIAMSLTIATMYSRSPSILPHHEVVKDSYPNFFEDLRKIGAKFEN
jgi:3-phosphoshikimate 1-carboxyvinyltransferase